ncbi:MAG: pentapeptide repeat-containing protein [Bacteroidales bacterium]|nr:pentapeptide repeat-containing protein [Bacteroidales bacterium]
MNIKSTIIVVLTLFMSMAAFVNCNANSNAANSDKIEASDLIKKMQKSKHLTIEGKHIAGELKLHDGGEGARQLELAPSYIDCELTFVNCVFEDNVISTETTKEGTQIVYGDFRRNVTFKGCRFMKDLKLSQSVFEGNFLLEQCVINGVADLTGVHFAGGLSMAKTEMQQEAIMISTIIDVEANFMKSKFDYTCNMQNARINCQGMFVDSRFGGNVDFSGIYAMGKMNFTNAQFSGKTECIGTYIVGTLYMPKCHFVGDVTFEGSTVLGDINLNSATMDGKVNADKNWIMGKSGAGLINGLLK